MPIQLAKELLSPGSVEMRTIIVVGRRRHFLLDLASSLRVQVHRSITVVDFLHGDDHDSRSLLFSRGSEVSRNKYLPSDGGREPFYASRRIIQDGKPSVP